MRLLEPPKYTSQVASTKTMTRVLVQENFWQRAKLNGEERGRTSRLGALLLLKHDVGRGLLGCGRQNQNPMLVFCFFSLSQCYTALYIELARL